MPMPIRINESALTSSVYDFFNRASMCDSVLIGTIHFVALNIHFLTMNNMCYLPVS